MNKVIYQQVSLGSIRLSYVVGLNYMLSSEHRLVWSGDKGRTPAPPLHSRGSGQMVYG